MILDPIKRAHLLNLYLREGYKVAKPLAIEYGVKPAYLNLLARNSGYSVGEVKKQRAAVAVTAMLVEFKIARSDLCVSKFKEHVRARSIAIKRLHRLGFGYDTIANALNINVSSVRYWLSPDYRNRKKVMCLQYNALRTDLQVSP